MESFSRMLNAQMVLLAYLAVGMYCMKEGLIDRDTKKKLVDIILKITLPCMIFNSFNKPLTPEVLIQTALILVVAVAISILSFLLGKVIYNKYPQKKKSILQYCTLVNNSGFLGMPMVSAVYGSDGLFAASILSFPTASSCGPRAWPCSLPLISGQNAGISFCIPVSSPYFWALSAG